MVIGALPTISWLANCVELPPPVLDPRRRGAVIAANRSAPITPLRRTVRLISPRTTLAVLKLAGTVCALTEGWRAMYHTPTPANTISAALPTRYDMVPAGLEDKKFTLLRMIEDEDRPPQVSSLLKKAFKLSNLLKTNSLLLLMTLVKPS
jgi:hypothetical protein